MVLIAPPSQRDGQRIRKPADVAQQALLHHQTVPDAWERWCDRHRVNTANTALGPQFDQYQTQIRAVSVGMGLGLVPECLVQQELARGEVVTPLPGRGVELESGYCLCYPSAHAAMPALLAFKGWLLGESGTQATR